MSSIVNAESATRAIERWRARGRTIPTRDGAIWVVDEPGSDPAATPVLLLHGFPSSAFDFEIPGARFETWDDLGHWPQIEDPARVAKTVSAFWDGLD